VVWSVLMPLNRFLNLPNEEKERVLGISKVQFAINGYDATSLNLLLKELGISKGQFYYWFEDKLICFSPLCKKAWMHFVCAWMNMAIRPRPQTTGVTCESPGSSQSGFGTTMVLLRSGRWSPNKFHQITRFTNGLSCAVRRFKAISARTSDWAKNGGWCALTFRLRFFKIWLMALVMHFTNRCSKHTPKASHRLRKPCCFMTCSGEPFVWFYDLSKKMRWIECKTGIDILI